MEWELLSTATDAGVFSSPLLSSPLPSSGNLGFFMNECMAVCSRCLLFECELAWCYEGDGEFFAFGGGGVLFRVPVSPILLLLPPPVLGFSLAVAARVVLCVCVACCPPSPPLNVSFSLADIQFEWLAAAG